MWETLISATYIAAVLRISTPYIFAAMGGMLSELVGIPNIALEGQMLLSAAMGALAAGLTNNIMIGVMVGLLSGALIGLALAFAVLALEADAIISGIALNLLAAGIASFTIFSVIGDRSGTTSLESGTLPKIEIPLISSIPFLRDTISGQNIMTYLALVLVPVLSWLLYKTKFGYHLRAVGENYDAAKSVGIKNTKVQYLTMSLAGALAAGGGIYLSMGAVSFFVNNMTAGRGFIALAAIFLGRKKPKLILSAALGFGATEALALQLGGNGVPTQLVTAIPYIFTLLVLAFASARTKPRKIYAPRKRMKIRSAH